MRFEFVALVTISDEAPAAFLLAVLVGGYKLRNARKSTRAGRDRVVEIDEQVAGAGVSRIATYGYRRFGSLDARANQVVRHEAAVTKRPEELVQAAGRRFVASVDVHSVLESVGFFGEAACIQMSRLFARLTQDIEVDARHG